MMAGIKGKDTKPERIIRSLLHRKGFRFRLHRSDLPGKPDIVLAKWKAVILVHGCFWHGHGNCPLYRPPKSRENFWGPKILGNIARDKRNLDRLHSEGWRTLTIWECALKGRSSIDLPEVSDRLAAFLTGSSPNSEIRGRLLFVQA